MPRPRFFWHLFVGCGALLVAVIAGCFFLASLELARLADEAQLRRMTDAAAGLAARLPADPAAVTAESFAAASEEISRTARAAMDLLSADGRVLFAGTAAAGTGSRGADLGWPSGMPAILAEASAGRVAHASRYDAATARRLLAAAVPVGPKASPTAIIRVAADTAVADRELALAQRQLLAGSVPAALVALAAAYALARRAARPLRELSQVAARVAGGEIDARLPVPEAAELSVLAGAIDTLREQLVERGLTIGRQGTQQEAVLGSMIEGVLAIDARQRIVSINQGAADLLGLDVDSVLLKPLQEVVRNPDLRRFALLAIDCREPVEDDIILRGVRDRTIRVRGTALRDVSGEGGAVIVLNDVTDLQRLENVRRDFVANVSHELKTPIASIKGFVETLLDGAAEDPADSRRFLEIIARQAERLESIIEDLLALSRIEQAEGAGNLPVERVPLAAVLDEAVADCRPRAADRAIQLETAYDGGFAADVNAALIEQAVINLVDNAIKSSEPGRTVRIAAAADAVAPGGVTIAVQDQGCGIAPEHLPRLFERFYRVDKARSRKAGGTGLGLSIVKHIVQAHGGTVVVESEPGVGSTFTIRLPAAARK